MLAMAGALSEAVARQPQRRGLDMLDLAAQVHRKLAHVLSLDGLLRQLTAP
jgi:hypothetical protein